MTDMKLEWTNNLEALFQKDIARLSEYEKEIYNLSDNALSCNDPYEALKLAQLVSYNLIASRAFISKSLSHIRQINKGLNDKSQALLKRHEVNLISKLSRLTELREDLLALQRISYTLRNHSIS